MDKSKLHKKHQDIYVQVMTSKLIPEEGKRTIYNLWSELNKHPEKNWNTKAVKDKAAEVAKLDD